jgi:predicted transcriptional regulator
MLEKLRTRKMTNAQAADALGVSETYLSRTVAAMQEKVPGKVAQARAAAAKLAQARRRTREDLAKQVKAGELDVGTAAERAACSLRTMSRYVAAYVPPRRNRRKSAKAA